MRGRITAAAPVTTPTISVASACDSFQTQVAGSAFNGSSNEFDAT